MDRRRYLAALVTAPVVSVAGCSDDAGADTEADAGTVTDTVTSTDTTTATPTDSPTAAATDTSTATATDGAETATDTTATATDTETATPTATATPSLSQTVQVAPGSFRFSPKSFEVAVGATVEWVWEADGHNVVVDSQPAGSDWSGTPGNDLYDEGYTHEHTFQVPGTYEYHCDPHEGLGMVGSFTVVE